MLLLYSLTTFLAAALLFLIQPMMGKLLLPQLGGGPEIWNTCMVFFQAALLGGYAYAHLVPGRIGVRRHALVHPLLMLLAVPTFHLAVGEASSSVSSAPVPWLLKSLALSAGPVFLLIATSGPLLQRWFAASDHPAAKDPYFMYAASNAGSLVGLLAYPFLIEPNIGLRDQTVMFSWLYGGLVVLFAACGIALQLRAAPVVPVAPPPTLPAGQTDKAAPGTPSFSEAPITWARRGLWILLAAVPSSLMLGVTHFLSTDVAAIPLMWVIPLTIYLLSFMLVFSRHPIFNVESAAKLLPIIFGGQALMSLMYMRDPAWIMFTLHILGLFLACMLCHGRLAALRPPPKHLTEFYLLMSVGGMLGGMFNALFAPVVFNLLLEYPIAIGVACMLRPPDEDAPAGRRWDLLLPVGVLGVLILTRNLIPDPSEASYVPLSLLILGPPVVVTVVWAHRRVLGPALAMLCMLIWPTLVLRQDVVILQRVRSFFGITRIVATPDRSTVIMTHGTTLHGKQFLIPSMRNIPSTYYHRDGPLGQVFNALEGTPKRQRVAVIGLGTGTVAAYARPGDHYTFFEIDPEIVPIAENVEYFPAINDARTRGATIDYRIGDGRKMMEQEPDGTYGFIIVDAFSSDAIPAHMLTVQSIATFKRKLAPNGVLMLHVSNRHLSLLGVVAKVAELNGLMAFFNSDKFPISLNAKIESLAERVQARRDAETAAGKEVPASVAEATDPESEELTKMLFELDRGLFQDRGQSVWTVLVKQPDDVPLVDHVEDWKLMRATPTAPTWTDDFTDILSVFKF